MKLSKEFKNSDFHKKNEIFPFKVELLNELIIILKEMEFFQLLNYLKFFQKFIQGEAQYRSKFFANNFRQYLTRRRSK
jgi:hypothetical protein